jgi:hypothetical protein
MEEVRRSSDDELCGFVEWRDGVWRASAVFGATLGEFDQEADAIAHVRGEGLAALAQRWLLDRRDGQPETVVCLVEANASGVTLALGYYAMPDVPTLWVSSADVVAGDVVLRR